MTELNQRRTGRLADDFFLMVHDDPSGRPWLSDRRLGLGLAGALLAELAVAGSIRVVNDAVVVTPHEPRRFAVRVNEPPRSAVLDELYRKMRQERGLVVRDWLDYLSPLAVDRVARRLESWRLVYLKLPRVKLPGRTGRWFPVDFNTAGWPAVDVKLKVHNDKADAHTLMLFGLTAATGMSHPSLWDIRDRLNDPSALEQTLEPLDESPPLRELLAHTEAAVASAVNSQRRIA